MLTTGHSRIGSAFISLFLIAVLFNSLALGEVVNVVLIAGQSNASGRADIVDLPSSTFDSSVEFFYDTDVTGASTRLDSNGQFVPLAPPSSTFGPEMSLGRTLNHKGIDNLALIKVTRGGTNLRTDWEKGNTSGDEMYSLFVDTVGDAFDLIEQRGDTVNVIGLAWHQGEGDNGFENSNPGSYQSNLTQFISDVRADLALPNLPFMIGGVFEPNRENLYAAQQATAAAVANTEFISSAETSVFDVTTHLDGKSQLWMGTRFANALTLNENYVEFESPNFEVGHFTDQNGWVSAGTSENRIVSTISSGRYVAGQAAGHVDSGGSEYLGTKQVVPIYGRSMSANFFAGDNTDHDQDGSADYDEDGVSDSSVRLFGWVEDANNDGFFSSSSSNDPRSVGFGLDNDGTINLRTADGNEISTGVTYTVDNWYQLTLTWSEKDENDERQVRLFAENLTGESSLNNGAPILSMALSAAQFGADPDQWIGTGIRATRGLVDNIHYSANEILAGDYNSDGIVDAADYTVWRDSMGSDESFPNDLTPGVGQDDYHHWVNNFGASLNSSSKSVAIPEPGSFTLFFIMATVISTSRW